jgi:hypothetical protein
MEGDGQMSRKIAFKAATVAVVFGSMASVAWAETSTLTDPQMDQITAGSSIAVESLSDGRLQLFYVAQGQLLSAWKQTQDPNSGWTALAAGPQPAGYVTDVAVGRLPDGRLQLFVDTNNGLFTSWKQAVDANAGWTNWITF